VNSGRLLRNTTDSLSLSNTTDSLVLSGNWLLSIASIVCDWCTSDGGSGDGSGSLTVRSGNTSSGFGLGVEGCKLLLSLSGVGVVLDISVCSRLDW
jgi:hypothetical protein